MYKIKRLIATIIVVAIIITQTGLGNAFALRQENLAEREVGAKGIGEDIKLVFAESPRPVANAVNSAVIATLPASVPAAAIGFDNYYKSLNDVPGFSLFHVNLPGIGEVCIRHMGSFARFTFNLDSIAAFQIGDSGDLKRITMPDVCNNIINYINEKVGHTAYLYKNNLDLIQFNRGKSSIRIFQQGNEIVVQYSYHRGVNHIKNKVKKFDADSHVLPERTEQKTGKAAGINESTIIRALLLRESGDYRAALDSLVGGSLTREKLLRIISQDIPDIFLDLKHRHDVDSSIDNEKLKLLTQNPETNLKKDLGLDSLSCELLISLIEEVVLEVDQEVLPASITMTIKNIGDLDLWTAIAWRASQEGFDLNDIGDLSWIQRRIRTMLNRLRKEITTGIALVISPDPLDRGDIKKDLKPFGFKFDEIITVPNEAAAKEVVDRINRDNKKTLVVVINHTGKGLTLTGIGQAKVVDIEKPTDANRAVEEAI